MIGRHSLEQRSAYNRFVVQNPSYANHRDESSGTTSRSKQQAKPGKGENRPSNRRPSLDRRLAYNPKSGWDLSPSWVTSVVEQVRGKCLTREAPCQRRISMHEKNHCTREVDHWRVNDWVWWHNGGREQARQGVVALKIRDRERRKGKTKRKGFGGFFCFFILLKF